MGSSVLDTAKKTIWELAVPCATGRPSLFLAVCPHTPSVAFRHLPPNSARTGYATGYATLYLRAAAHRRGQHPQKGSGESNQVPRQTSKRWFTTSFLQPLPYLVTPQGSRRCRKAVLGVWHPGKHETHPPRGKKRNRKKRRRKVTPQLKRF